MTEREAAAQGAQAARELALTETAFEGLRAALFEAIAGSAADAAGMRESLYLQIKTLDQVRQALVGAVAAGELAASRMALAEQDPS